MNQSERRIFLIQELLKEDKKYYKVEIPQGQAKQRQLLRSLMNVRLPQPMHEKFLKIQNEYLSEEIKEKGITDMKSLKPIQDDIYLWKGDITLLKVDAIVNAANSRLLGCFCPCHDCIDNAIHTFSGIQLRLACANIMQRQGCNEKAGRAKITPAFNLPCKYILHTVGPIIMGELTQEDCVLLSSCYRACMELAKENQIGSMAFCCISTGEFHFPRKQAAQIAIDTVKEYKEQKKSKTKVIFNVFKEEDYQIYERLLDGN